MRQQTIQRWFHAATPAAAFPRFSIAGISALTRHGQAPHTAANVARIGALAVSHAPPLPACGERSICEPLARSKSGEGALPRAQTRGDAPSPGFLRSARVPLGIRPLPARGRVIAYASQVSRLSSRAQRSTKWCAADPGPKYPGIGKEVRQGYLDPGSRYARPG